MADDRDEAPDDSIASALASAIAEHETRATGDETNAAAGKAAAANVVADSKMGGVSDREQRASKSAEKAASEAQTESKEESSEAEAGKPEEGAGAADEKPAASDKAISATEPPANWAAKDKETFKKLPADAQKFLLDRHKAMEADYGKKTQAIAAFKREYEPVDKIFEPYRERMKASGWTALKLIEAWSNVEKRLMEGDGVNVLAGLAKGYQINLGQVAQALGLRPRAPTNGAADPGVARPEQPQHQPQEITLPPTVARQLEAIQARLDADDRARDDAARRAMTNAEQRVMNEIDQFKSAQDDKGNPLHPHFDDVEEAMTLLAQSAIAARKPVPSLKELYESAVWANPSTREATLAARERAQQEKASAEARAKAAQARKAGSSIQGAPGSGQAPTGRNRADLSLREQLEANYAEASATRI